MTHDLIASLSGDLQPAPRAMVARRLAVGIAAGAAVSAALTWLTIGLRPDMAAAAGEVTFWAKLAYTLAIAAAAAWAAERLMRPAGRGVGRALWIAAPVAVLLGVAGWQLLKAPAAMRGPMLMGHSAGACPWRILAFSAPPLIGLVWAARGLAPVRLRATGLVIGLAAGGTGASAYALHCTEAAAPFLAVWYTLGVAGAGALGALLGPRLLRW